MATNNFLNSIVHPDAECYAETHTSPETDGLHALNRWTQLKTPQPHMLCGHYQGKLLEFLSCMIKPHCALEIGTFVGYSTVCLCKGLTSNGELHSIEVNEEYEDVILNTLKRNHVSNKVRLHIGDAMEILPQLKDKKFDLAFIDADKINYINYYNFVLPLMEKGGILMIDNVLWNGKVLYEQRNGDKETAVLKQLNDLIQNDARVENILLPIRDGLMMCRKI